MVANLNGIFGFLGWRQQKKVPLSCCAVKETHNQVLFACFIAHKSKELSYLSWKRRTHQVLADTTRSNLEVVPEDEQGQEERQHVELPIPDR